MLSTFMYEKNQIVLIIDFMKKFMNIIKSETKKLKQSKD